MIDLIITLNRKTVNDMSTMEKSSLRDELVLTIDNFIYPKLRRSEEQIAIEEFPKVQEKKPIVKMTAIKSHRQSAKTNYRVNAGKHKKEEFDVVCDFCGKTFKTHKKNKKNCSDVCAYESNLRNIRKINKAAKLKKQNEETLKETIETNKVVVEEKEKTSTILTQAKKVVMSELNLSLINELDTYFLGKERWCLYCGNYVYDNEEKNLYCQSYCVQKMKENIDSAVINAKSPRISDILYNGHKVRTYVSNKSYLYVSLNESIVKLMKEYKEKDL